MPLNIRNEHVNQLAESLANRLRLTKTEAVRVALENELHRLDRTIPLRERLRPLQERVQKWPKTGLQADKEFFDDLSGEP
ncbi:type II toxin-antitoxin system VapB family antitoxin [Reyranella sp.]|uniref:type II toxin-antitoxin system VapB family antitoxin n=1 Tax=Reyranella sp. TaxID=1929291 RepID=UPI0037838A43